jgi:hypothetical protein
MKTLDGNLSSSLLKFCTTPNTLPNDVFTAAATAQSLPPKAGAAGRGRAIREKPLTFVG